MIFPLWLWIIPGIASFAQWKTEDRFAERIRFQSSKLKSCKRPMPNRAHKALAKLEKMGKLKAVVTQNIDGLHQKAGSREVLELHGSVLRNYCTRCGKFYGLDAILNSTGVPKCTCGGTIKPDVVLYEEGLDQETIEKSVKYIANADVLIIGGTSLTVYPAAGLIDYYRGHKLVLINKSVTPMDNRADLVISGPIGEVLGDAVGV